MFYYKHMNKILIAQLEYGDLEEISECEAADSADTVFLLHKLDPLFSRKSYCVADSSLAFPVREDIGLLMKQPVQSCSLPQWLKDKIAAGTVTSINTAYPGWQDSLTAALPEMWRINVVGMGDVGGMLAAGLRLLGGKRIAAIGLYDIDSNKVRRWELEISQILSPAADCKMPGVFQISENRLFDCDMFVFCVTVGVPPLGETKDVRIAQLEGNSKIIAQYAKKAREAGFKGFFAVVSDPVDLLCKAAFLAGNTNENGELDFRGLAPDRIRGYGLGVMHARAAYYSSLHPETAHYSSSGRAFGPHGEGLVIADSITAYDHELSLRLTELARSANMEVRAAGFKPYIAPALSSGALSIIATISGEWHYSATCMGGIFWGARNRLLPAGTEIERLKLPAMLFARIKESYERLGAGL